MGNLGDVGKRWNKCIFEVNMLPINDKNPWILKNRRVAYENNFIRLDHDEVIRPDGKAGSYGRVHYKSKSVGVVILDHSDRVLLVGQYRYTLGKYSWEIPAGGAVLDEDPLETARRELSEETGYTAGSVTLLGHAHMSNSISDEEAFFYLGTDIHPGVAAPEGTELIETRWIQFEDALAAIKTGVITDALTILALQQLAIVRLGNSKI
jgi:8-oxo-dGTP pyrophosphatase MutT (NUDIX family)